MARSRLDVRAVPGNGNGQELLVLGSSDCSERQWLSCCVA